MSRRLSLIILLFLLSACQSTQKDSSSAVTKITKGPERMRIALGSCNDQEKDQSFWAKILTKKPDLWIGMGDNVYADTRNPNKLASTYEKLMNNKYYKHFAEKVKISGTWDDHDYGENDAGKDFPIKSQSRESFWNFIRVPETSELRSQDGIYRAENYRVGTSLVRILYLDARSFRDPLHKNSKGEYLTTDGDVLGQKQWFWLEKQMSEVGIAALIVVSGTQFLPQEHRFEKWANFPKSRNRLLKAFERSNARIKLILTGDRHFAEFSKFVFEDGTQLTEITSSGMTHSYLAAKENNKYRIGSLWPKTNFATLDFYEDQIGEIRAHAEIVDMKTTKSVSSIDLP